MNIQTFIYLYLISVPLFYLSICCGWGGGKNYYQSKLGHLLGTLIGWRLLFLPNIFSGINFLQTYPAVIQGKLINAVLYGAFFGFVTYVTYELTNLALLKDWPLSIVLLILPGEQYWALE